MIIYDEDDDILTTDDIICTYATIYASYILCTAHTGYDIAKAMLRVLPKGENYITNITPITDDKLKLTIDCHEIIIPITWDRNEIVTIVVDGKSYVAWDEDEVVDILTSLHVYPEDRDMLTLEYLTDWCKHLKDTYIFYDPYSQCLANELERYIE